MKTASAASNALRWNGFRWLLALALGSMAALVGAVFAQPLGSQVTTAVTPAVSPGATTQTTLTLEGPWRFQTGDDPRWADPDFDDSKWPVMQLGKDISEQGISPYSGYAWYRLRLTPEQLGMGQPGIRSASANGASNQNVQYDQARSLLVTSYRMGQLSVYADGAAIGRTAGIESQTLYQSMPLIAALPRVDLLRQGSDGSMVIAVRAWANLPITHGLLAMVEMGSPAAIQEKLELATDRRWDREALAPILACFLFLCVAGLGAILYLAPRKHSEYLWLALLCLSVTLRGAIEVTYNLALLSATGFVRIGNCTGFLFMVCTLEFVYRFTASGQRKLVRGAQVATLLVPLALFANWNPVTEYVTITVELFFIGLVIYLLFRAWHGGNREAGVMLIPFLLAGCGDVGDTLVQFAIERQWLPDRFAPHPHYLGPIQYGNGVLSYLLFLASLVAVIFYRFIRVSQQEQRSSAELEAARSVQALLIPTTLPSSRSFALDSAYLPANGVGGDFFQVLPLQDDSMLIVVGDVSGKGLQAAMNASTLVGALRNELAHEPATVLAHLNQVMLGNPTSEITNSVASFATCLCARIYPTGMMTIANAGHLSPYRDGREMELAPDLPLGVVANMTYEQATFQLKPGDRLIFLSDGVVEAATPKGELFGFERTQQISHESASYIAQTAKKFGQTDDITVVSLYFVAALTGRAAKEIARVH